MGITPTALETDTATDVAMPLLTAAQFLIPAGVALAGLHKLMQHQETGAGLLVDILIKGGGAILLIALIKAFAGLDT